MALDSLKPKLNSVSQEGTDDTPCYFLSLELENIKSFGPAQKLNLSDVNGKPVRWTILLGDNGVGKTTLLQSLASLIPKEFQPRVDAESQEPPIYLPELFLGHNTGDKYKNFVRNSTERSHISAQLAWGVKLDASEPSPATEENLRVDFESGGRGSTTIYNPALKHFAIYGYGAHRRSGSAALSEMRDENDSRATLFDENCSLLNSEEWLLQADYAATKSNDPKAIERLTRIKEILVSLLPDVDEIRIRPSGVQTPFIEVHTPYGWVLMRTLSSGYRSVVAWIVDLASRMFDRYPNSPDPLSEPAVVLVDQIDVFLHPKWQRELLKILTSIFRNAQFIVTAHSPLIVQAAPDAKIVLVHRNGDHAEIDTQSESIKGWRVDQIISSELFENLGIRDSETEELLVKRKAILIQPNLSAEDEKQLRLIEDQLGSFNSGETRDQVIAMDLIERAAKKLKNQ